MLAAWIFLGASIVGAAMTFNGFRPRRRGMIASSVSFFAGWLTTELALHHLLWQIPVTIYFLSLGVAHTWVGRTGLAFTLASWTGLVICFRSAWDAERAIDEALRSALPDLGPLKNVKLDWAQLLLPFPFLHSGIERSSDHVYATHGNLNLKLDVYRRRDRPQKCPTLLWIHGGGWIVGHKAQQGLPLMMHMAERGWVCVAANYRLSPRATLPEPLIDCKLALRWIREHADEFGIDPNFIVVTGGSAGAHLAAMVALTANDPVLQPGFEAADTRVTGCVAFYGIYDFLDEDRKWPHEGLRFLLRRYVFKSDVHEAREAWRNASPLHRVHRDAPPFLVIHGERDTVVPPIEAERFCETLRAVSTAPVVHAQIPGAQHAFEVFPSPRATFVIHGVAHFLMYLHAKKNPPGASP